MYLQTWVTGGWGGGRAVEQVIAVWVGTYITYVWATTRMVGGLQGPAENQRRPGLFWNTKHSFRRNLWAFSSVKSTHFDLIRLEQQAWFIFAVFSFCFSLFYHFIKPLACSYLLCLLPFSFTVPQLF